MELTTKLFFSEIKKSVDNEKLLDMYKTYLDNKEVNVDSLEYVLDNNEYKDIIIACHKLFVISQDMLDELSCKDIEIYENRDIEIVSCYTFYSSVNMILYSNLEEKLADFIVKIYEDLNLKINCPRVDEEENKEFFDAKRAYYCRFYFPLKMAKLEIPISEYDFALLYYKTYNKSEVPAYISEKTKFSDSDLDNGLEEIFNKIGCDVTRKILEKALFV